MSLHFTMPGKRISIILLFLVTVIISFGLSSSAYAWFYYSKPAFCGRVIDAETKQPIEGAVVVVLYYKRSTFSLNPGGTSSYITKAKETLTDEKGEFYFPSYSELMLLTEDVGARFTFFKPGYKTGYVPIYISPYLEEKYFSAAETGKVAEIEAGSFDDSSYVKWKGPLGILELERAKTYEERRKTRPSSGGLETNQLPIFFRMLDEEYKYLYK